MRPDARRGALAAASVLTGVLLAVASGVAHGAIEIQAPGPAPATPMDAPTLLWVWVVFIGLCVGSFLNVVIHRLPIMMQREERIWATEVLAENTSSEHPSETQSETIAAPYNLMVPRSACPGCGHAIGALENIPLLSWLALRGRCRGCGDRISVRYPLVELFTCLLTVAAIMAFGFTPLGAYAALFTWALVALTMIDVDHQLLPDSIVLPLLWLGLFVNLDGTLVALDQAVVGAIVGYGSLWSIYWGFKLITGKEGMGYGDFKLMGAMGAWLGWTALPGLVLLASLSGIIAAIVMMIGGRLDRGAPMPFGPFIAVAGWLALILPALGIGLPGY